MAVATAPHSIPLSLYLDLFNDASADIETVARAALGLTAALREAAYIIDPSVRIRIELVSGTQGSLSLNSLIRIVGKNDRERRRNLTALAIMALLWFGEHVGDKAFDAAWDAIFNSQSQPMSDRDKEDIARKVKEGQRNQSAREHVSEVYQALDRDPAIRGVGATVIPGKRPDGIVKKENFESHLATPDLLEPPATRRVRKTKERLALISPILMNEASSSNRRWKFSGHEGEFGAYIRDTTFLKRLLHGKLQVPMVDGIALDVEMDVTETFESGVWVVAEREITKVRRVIPPAIQPPLPLVPAKARKKNPKKAPKKK